MNAARALNDTAASGKAATRDSEPNPLPPAIARALIPSTYHPSPAFPSWVRRKSSWPPARHPARADPPVLSAAAV